MNLDQLRTFRLVLERGSFSRAAEALQISQSTVSFQIKALETGLGARLLDRTGRTARATPTGRLLLGYARRLLALADEAAARVRAEEEGGTGQVAIAASTIPGEYLLPPLLGGFRAAHPEISFVVDVADSRRAARALLDGSCDLALVGARLADGRIEWLPFAEDEIVLVGPAAAAGALPRGGLAAVPLVLRELGSGTRDAVARLLPERPDGGAPSLQVGSTEAARRCVLAGLGYSLISRTAVADDLAAARLRLVKLPRTPVRRRFYVGRLRAVTPSAAARTLLRFILGKDLAP